MAEEKERKLKEFTSCVDNAKTKNAESVKRLTDENKTLKSEVSSLKKQLTSIQKICGTIIKAGATGKR